MIAGVGSREGMENAAVQNINAAAAANTQNTTDLKTSGQQLRAEIDALYRRPPKEVRYNDPNGLDITDTLIKYLPIGISFDAAESILRFAGFKVSRVAAHQEGNTKASATVEAHIVPYGRFLYFWSYYSSVNVTLVPKRPDDYTEVGAVSGNIFWPAL